MTSKYTPEEKAKMMAEARETLARLAEERAVQDEVAPTDDPPTLPPVEDRLARWKREALSREREYERGARDLKQREAQVRRQAAEELRQQQEQTAQIAAASRQDDQATLAQLRALNVTMEVLARLDERLARVEELLKASNAKAAAIAEGSVIDLPQFLRKTKVN
jgi:hypothetical protein